MKLTTVVKLSFSSFSLLSKVKTLGESTSPAELVAISQGCPAIKSIQTTSELVELANLVKEQRCKYLLEIGTYKGGTLFVFSQCSAEDATIMSLDYHFSLLGKLVRVFQGQFFRRFVRRGQKLILVRGDSHKPETLALIERSLQGNKLDFLFIDGDHRYEGVKQDFTMYSPLVRSGGMVAFHDVAQNSSSVQVGPFWQEVKAKYAHKEFIHEGSLGTLGIGVLWV